MRTRAPGGGARSAATAALPALPARPRGGTPALQSTVGNRATRSALAGARAAPGAPLPPAVRALFERSLGRDLGAVRVHAGPAATSAARSLGARAYTEGTDVHLGAGADPGSRDGQALLAHEVAHAAQHALAGAGATTATSAPGDGAEREADRAARAMLAGAPATVSASRGIHRQALGPALPSADDAIARLEMLLAPVFFADQQRFFLDAVTRPLASFNDTFTTALAVPTPPPALLKAMSDAIARMIPRYRTAGDAIRDAAADLANASSVVKLGAITAPGFPTPDATRALAREGARLSALARDRALPVAPDQVLALTAAATALQDGALATLQALSVMQARAIWARGAATDEPTLPLAAHRARTVVDEVFAESGYDAYGATETAPGSGNLADWCGMFVATAMIRSGGLDQDLRAGFWHTDNVEDFFGYTQTATAARVPLAIFAEGQWWALADYHRQRGSTRRWTDRAAIAGQLAAGDADIRPGDVCLINHQGGATAQHIVMVESYDHLAAILATIEGNRRGGIRANAQGGVTRLPAPHEAMIADTGRGQPHSVVTLRDLDRITPAIAAAHAVAPATAPVPGAAGLTSGNTILGVGRPSLVDFEAHDYAIRPVPAILALLSPDRIRALAKQAGVTDPQAKQQQKEARAQLGNLK